MIVIIVSDRNLSCILDPSRSNLIPSEKKLNLPEQFLTSRPHFNSLNITETPLTTQTKSESFLKNLNLTTLTPPPPPPINFSTVYGIFSTSKIFDPSEKYLNPTKFQPLPKKF